MSEEIGVHCGLYQCWKRQEAERAKMSPKDRHTAEIIGQLRVDNARLSLERHDFHAEVERLKRALKKIVDMGNDDAYPVEDKAHGLFIACVEIAEEALR